MVVSRDLGTTKVPPIRPSRKKWGDVGMNRPKDGWTINRFSNYSSYLWVSVGNKVLVADALTLDTLTCLLTIMLLPFPWL